MREAAPGVRLPDFYAIGAPRSGTTTIYEVLRRQPGISLPIKEPRFWCDDLDSGSPADGLFFTRTFQDYAALYQGARSDKLVGDMSTWYLFSQHAVPRILDATPDARFIVGIRNPVDLMESLHALRVTGLSEDIVDFKQALAAEEDRLRGHQIPPNVRNRSGLYYRRVARLGEQLRRLATNVPRDRVHVYVYEDFRNDPRAILNGILEFLEMPPMPAGEPIPVANRRPGAVRGRTLRTILIAPKTVSWAKRLLPAPIRQILKRSVNAATLRPVNRRAGLSESERRALLESFRADVEMVSEFTGRDMWTIWSGASSSKAAAER
jgi:hypothetical protein